jgi:hypothetical protein
MAASSATIVRLSTDPYTNTSSQHQTEVEPDSFAYGSTIVMAFQVGRFTNGGSSNVGWATSTDNGATWTNGFLPRTTVYADPPGPYGRDTDPSVAYDAKHGVWMIVSLVLDSSGGSIGPIVSRSTDGGLTWNKPVTVDFTGGFADKTWIVCDNTPTSPFYGNCYVEWDDNGLGNQMQMNTSTDGGLTWGGKKTPSGSPSGLGGQPLVRKNGTVVVPYTANYGGIEYFTSTNGGSTWGAAQFVASQSRHGEAGGLRTPPLPSAEIDKRGRVFVAWHDCRFRSGCPANDIVYAIIKPNGSVSSVKRVPIDPTSSGVDHFTPGFAVDVTTGGTSTHLGVTYYYYPVSNCGSTCELHIGFVSSTDTGSTWSAPIDLAGPMQPTWLASTNQGRMFGDYISGSFVNGKVFPTLIVANAPTGQFDEAAYTTTSGLLELGPGTLSAANDEPVAGAVADRPAPAPTAR